MGKFDRIATIIAVTACLVALVPMARLAIDLRTWSRYMAEFPELAVSTPNRTAEGFDWVWWVEADGQIEASWVFPTGPGDRGGIRAGDRFFMLEFTQYFDVDDLRQAIGGTSPGESRTYVVEREGTHVEAVVHLGRYPTFLYPRSGALWTFALWGFGIGAFIHLVALLVAAPLARQNRRARSEFALILVSAVWIVGNLLRMGLVSLFGPPEAGDALDSVFRTLTLVGLVGWLGFPLLLLSGVLRDARRGRGPRWDPVHLAVAAPPVALGSLLVLTAIAGVPGPLTLEGLLVPILFYASCAIAASALIVQTAFRLRDEEADRVFGGWGPVGSLVIALVAVAAAIGVSGLVPLGSALSDASAGWILVSAQLLAVAPVTLYSYRTLRHGKMEEVISRSLVYLVVLGLIFFAFVGGISILEPYMSHRPAASQVVSGLYVVLLLLVADRLARRLRDATRAFFRSEYERGRQALSRFQERMRDILEMETLCREAVEKVSDAVQSRSSILFLRSGDSGETWVSSTFHPEPPYLTEQVFRLVWPGFLIDPRVWAANSELDERSLPADSHALLLEVGAALAVPIRGDQQPAGLLVLGHKRTNRAVYNLEDVDLLRSISGQLALAAERLALVEREKRLAREASESQLIALRSQINPHFLFNALNTIASLIDERPGAAEAAVEHLAAIFRFTLQVGDRPFVSLQDEIELVEHYLAIEKARFGDKLDVSIEVDADVRSLPVPAFVVQTLVENAVKHGVERSVAGGRVRLTARKTGAGTTVTVFDSGVGIPALFPASSEPLPADFFGIGLRNVSERMRLHYGRNDLFDLTSSPDLGTEATLHFSDPSSATAVPS